MPIAIAGTHSGVGKTTVTLSILAALQRWGIAVQSFKVGPDYIDPMFHTAVTGRPCRNLDPVITSNQYVQSCFAEHNANADGAAIEGVMGLFDGAGSDELGSTAHVVKLLGKSVSVILAIDCSRMSRSLAATIYGYHHFDADIKLAGVILNRVGSDRHREILLEAIAPLGIPVLGIIPREEGIKLSDRHLGLVPSTEIANFDRIIDRLADLGKRCFDWENLMPLIRNSQSIPAISPQPLLTNAVQNQPNKPINAKVRIAVARDRAFNFYYADNLDILEKLGAELVDWSPLDDAQLPDQIHGLYFGGGFPEIFAAQLAENQGAIASIRQQIHLPIYAECGGLMYLSEAIVDFAGNEFAMVGAIPTQTVMADKLTLGYRCGQVLTSDTWLPTNQPVWGHEFHRSCQTIASDRPLYQLKNYAGRDLGAEGWGRRNFLASYVHLHWGGNPSVAAGLVGVARAPQYY
ncbi:MAG: cobyrinate a,c-diamide synthase [Pseudanabaena sp. CRU_2_10]|nr:cobyrinate a,c-diamide synthase [Pseudanabaena sp. CRU_2_10]